MTGSAPRWTVVLMVGLAFAVAWTAVARSEGFSLLDENTHVDYTWKLAHGEVPAAGSLISPEVLDLWSCDGQPNVRLPACGSGAPASEYPARGENYNFWHPPLYYAITAGFAAAGEGLLGLSFQTAGRLTGALWLAGAMVLFFAALRAWGVRWPIALAAACALPTAGYVLTASSTVTNDAPAPLCSAAALWLCAGIVLHDRAGLALAAGLSGVAAATKILNALPFLLLALVLVVTEVRRRREGVRIPDRRRLHLAAALVVPVAVVYLGWTAVQSLRGVEGYESPIAGISADPIQGLPLTEWLSTAFVGFNLLANASVNPSIAGVGLSAWTTLLGSLVIAAPLLGTLALARTDATRTIGVVALVGVLLYPSAVQLQVFLTSGGKDYFVTVSPRYGLTLLPFALAALAVVAERNGATRLAGGLTALGVVLVLVTITGLGLG